METSLETRTDQELLAAYSRGSEAGFSALMERHARPVKSYALRMLRNAEQAEDICSETFLRVAMAKGGWEQRGASFRSYLFRIAHNLCIDFIRRNRTARNAAAGVLELTLHQQVRPSPEADAILGERAGMLERALGQLSEEHRQVVLLRSIHGLSAKEAASVIGCSPSQVDSRLSYARKMLKEQLAGLERPKATGRKGGGR
jgi:RNA polymerase sigma-70 factor, ECF subfamily